MSPDLREALTRWQDAHIHEVSLRLQMLNARARLIDTFAYRPFGASHQEMTMSDKTRNYEAYDPSRASPAHDEANTEAMAPRAPARPKHRAFVRDRLEHTPWSAAKDDGIEIVKLNAQALADAIDRAYVRVPADERRTYEYELARQALEDCVMRATRMITS